MLKQGGVIKADTVDSHVRTGLRTLQLNDVLDEARMLVARAHAEAENIQRQADAMTRQAQARAKQIEEDARKAGDARGHQEGLERGREEGFKAGRQEAFDAAKKEFAQQQAGLVDSCKAVISKVNDGRDAWWTAARQDLIDLAMAVARRVAHHVGEEHREAVLTNLEQAVRLVGARSDVTIAVNPKDAEAARAFAKSLIEMREQWQRVRVVDEPDVAPGGCRVQWGSGSIDATLETQLDRIDAELNAGKRAITEE